MSKLKPTFEVDRAGMRKVFARKGKSFVVTELLQNAWDENTTRVDVKLEKSGHGKARITVEDDNPEGFADLAHAYTLFAESAKKSDPTKRGRFNLGEKLVIAVTDEARITSTKGSILFGPKGRSHSPTKRDHGTVFEAILPLNKSEIEEVEAAVRTLIPPPGITTTYNGTEVEGRKPLTTFTATLRTEISDEEGSLKPTTRKTTVEVHQPLPGEAASIYEMGIPVVETGDRFHVNVAQKVPLNIDRDNVSPAYLRDIRAHVLNNAHHLLSADDAQATWVSNAMEDEKASPEAVEVAFKKRFGEKAVIFDPSDHEANKIAFSQGYTVVPGRSLSKGAWANVKGHGVALAAGKVTPSPDPSAGEDEIKIIDPEKYTLDVANVVAFAEEFAEAIMGRSITVRVASAVEWPFSATYGGGQLTLNLGRLGHKWFQADQNEQGIIDLLIHEFGHEYESDHLSRKYLNALTRLGAKATLVALTNPGVYNRLAVNTAVPA